MGISTIATGRKQAESGGVQAEGDQETRRAEPGGTAREEQGTRWCTVQDSSWERKRKPRCWKKGFRGGSRVECWEEPQVLKDPGRAAITSVG